MNTVEMIEIINKVKSYQWKNNEDIKYVKNQIRNIKEDRVEATELYFKQMVEMEKDNAENYRNMFIEIDELKKEIKDLKHQIYSLKRN